MWRARSVEVSATTASPVRSGRTGPGKTWKTKALRTVLALGAGLIDNLGRIPGDSSDKSPGIRPPLKESYRNDQSYHHFRTACGGSRENHPVAACADRPRALAGGAAASRALVAPSPPERLRWAWHLHRCVPLPVRPFFFIARSHTGRFFALLDGVLTPSSPPPGAHHFPRGEKTCRHAHSYKARPRS